MKYGILPDNAVKVANYFIYLANKNGHQITNMKLQKLVYFAEGWYLAINDGKSLIDEMTEAWNYGPVVPSVYHEFKHFGNDPIKYDSNSHKFNLSDEKKEFLDEVYEALKGFSALQLSNLTHVDGGPWKQVFDEYKGIIPKNKDIPRELIKDYFEKNLVKNTD